MKIIFKLMLGIFLIFLYFIVVINQEENTQELNFKNLDLKVSGIITGITRENGYNGFGIIRLKILTTNISSYDPRDSIKFYYCVVQDSIAEIYDHAFGLLSVGDTFNVDTQKRLSWNGGYGNKYDEGSISINRSERFYAFIKK